MYESFDICLYIQVQVAVIVIVLACACPPLLLLPSVLHDIYHPHLQLPLHLSSPLIVYVLHSVLLQLTTPDLASAPHFTALLCTSLHFTSPTLLPTPLNIVYTYTAVTHLHPHTHTNIHTHTHTHTKRYLRRSWALTVPSREQDSTALPAPLPTNRMPFELVSRR